jgi:hypothetical protein
MSHDELVKLNHRLDEIYKDLSRDAFSREAKHQQAHEGILAQIREISEQNKRQFQMLEPIYKIFTNVKGFNGITSWLLKTIILLGAAVGAIYGFFKWLKS